jgi:hypothetical protein
MSRDSCHTCTPIPVRSSVLSSSCCDLEDNHANPVPVRSIVENVQSSISSAFLQGLTDRVLGDLIYRDESYEVQTSHS